MKQLSKYQIREHLGGGATADVYLAYDPFLKINVALKVIKPDILKNPELAGRVRHMFMNEARLVRELQHPNIMAILDAVQDETKAYLVLEYVDGKPLSDYIKPDKLLPVATALQIAFKCCNAMEYASGLGLIHRDLKPNNLMLTRTGDIKISDFGASQIVDSQATQLSGVVGSPSYMSPEQIGEKELDFRSDMFSLGVVLYELLVGRRPFEADNMMTLMYQITQIPHKPLLARRVRLPAALDLVIDTALQKNPENRFPTWQAFADSLAAIDASLVVTKDEAPDRAMFMALRTNPFFESFNDAQIWQTLRVARWHKLRTGAVLIDEGQAGNSFSILIEGEADVSRNGTRLARIKPGASMGEMAFLTPDDPQRSATITAATQVLVLKMTRATLEEAGVDLRAQFERRFLQILVDRLRAANP